MDISILKEIGVWVTTFLFPPVHQTSMWIYNLLLIPVVFFSLFFYFISINGMFFSRKKGSFANNVIKWPSVTIQIPTLNEPVALRCAKSCLNFDYPRNKFEVIIGDDSVDPKVSGAIDDFSKKYRGRIKVTRRGSNDGFKAGNLNNMLKYSNGDIIVIFDSDFIPNKDFLKRIVRPFTENEKIGCVQARWGFANENQNRISKFASGILLVYHRLIAPINNNLKVPLLFGSGQAIRKDLITSLGGWQEGSLTEDVELSLRILDSGHEIVYLEDVKVSGELPFTLKGIRTQQKKWAYGNINAFLDHYKSILFGHYSFKQKFMLLMTLLGYISSLFLIIFILSGFVYFFTENPAPINLYKFTIETSKTLLVSSGFMFAALVALSKERKMNLATTVISSAFTVGFLVAISVCSGIFRAILGKKMTWSMIPKKGNFDYKTKNLKKSS
jgi:cellulose synthase/poly-beta-1,6-N-acetylglucosamine synthase-like glycosyltransferase